MFARLVILDVRTKHLFGSICVAIATFRRWRGIVGQRDITFRLMQVVPFMGQLADVAQLYGRTADEQAERDRTQTQAVRRWLGVDKDVVVAVVTAWLRPDDRLFLVPGWTDASALAALAASVGDELGRSVSLQADFHGDLIGALSQEGFMIETVSEAFEVPFASVLGVLARAKQTLGYSIVSAADAAEDRLFDLDNALRNLVRGTDGWFGDRAWFHQELAESPPFDSRAYLVAVHKASGDYVGLVRVWRNPAHPRLGMVGVLPTHRSTTVAVMLLGQALEAASLWGSDTFLTEVSIEDQILYPRVLRYGGVSRGRFAQLTRS